MERQIVEQELEKLVEIAKTEVPILSEIRVFGSYNNKNWDPEKSDIDVLLEVGVSGYSVLSLEYQRDTPDCIVQDKRARKITMEIRRLINGKFSDRFSFFVLTEDNIKK